MLDKAGQRVTSHLKTIMNGDKRERSEPICRDRVREFTSWEHMNHSARVHMIQNWKQLNLKLDWITDRGTGIKYARGKLLGKGGFANCYELIDTSSYVLYACKIIPKERISQPHQRAKITREIDLHKSLHHKNIVQFHTYFEDEENVYIVLEYCGRKSLVHVLKNRKVLTEPEVRFYLRQLVDGVRYVHDKKIIHRDLKLGNMLLCSKMDLKIADFGLATKVNYVGDKKMTVCGTPNYIAPEVLQKRGHSFEADIWALGCVMYAMLVGVPPFETPTLKETYLRIATNRFFIPSSVSETARALMKRMLAPTPEQRPTLDEIADDEFFYSGYNPAMLSPRCCTAPPEFPVNTPVIHRPVKPVSKVVKETTFGADDVTESVIKDAHYQLKAPVPETKIVIRPPVFPSPPQTELSNGHDSGVHSRQGSPTENEGLDLVCGAPSDHGGPPAPPPRHNLAQVSAKLNNSSHGLAVKLCQRISNCLDRVETCVSNPPVIAQNQVSWIIKWVDYSNKYGFGFQLSSRAVGVLFNDTTRIALSADGRMVEFTDLSEKTMSFSVEHPPSKLQKRCTLLTYFATYMDENLIQGGDVDRAGASLAAPSSPRCDQTPTQVFMKKWFRTSKAIVMYLSNGTLQVNFFDDHTKIILSLDRGVHCLTYIDENRRANTYHMDDILRLGCTEGVYERMQYARDMLQNIIDIEGETI